MSSDETNMPNAALTPAEEEFVALETAATLATPGPWHVTGTCSVRDVDEQMVAKTTAYHHNDLDAEFIAAASPSAVLKLIRRLRDTERERDEMIRQVEIMNRQVRAAEQERDMHYRCMLRVTVAASEFQVVANEAMIVGLAECERLRAEIDVLLWRVAKRNGYL